MRRMLSAEPILGGPGRGPPGFRPPQLGDAGPPRPSSLARRPCALLSLRHASGIASGPLSSLWPSLLSSPLPQESGETSPQSPRGRPAPSPSLLFVPPRAPRALGAAGGHGPRDPAAPTRTTPTDFRRSLKPRPDHTPLGVPPHPP